MSEPVKFRPWGAASRTPHLEEPLPEQPVPEEPIPEEPVPDEPVLTEPVSDEPLDEKPVHKRASTRATQKPVAGKPLLVPATEGDFTMWPNSFWREIAPTLDPVELPVLCQIYYLGTGHHKDGTPKNGVAKVSLPRLAELANKSVSGVRKATNRLIARGLLERYDTDGDSSDWYDRGTRWKAIVTRVESKRVAAGKGSPAKTGPPETPKKEHEKDSQKDPVSLMAVRIVSAAMERGEGKLAAHEIERRMRDALAVTGGDYSDVEIIAAARQYGRAGE